MYVFPLKEREFKKMPRPAADGSNRHDFFIPDVIGKERFVLNYGGYPRNDISLINEQTDIKAAKKILDSLTILPDMSGFDNDVAALQSMRSKYCQTFAEGQRYIREQMEVKLSEARAANVSESSIQFDNDDGKVEINE